MYLFVLFYLQLARVDRMFTTRIWKTRRPTLARIYVRCFCAICETETIFQNDRLATWQIAVLYLVIHVTSSSAFSFTGSATLECQDKAVQKIGHWASHSRLGLHSKAMDGEEEVDRSTCQQQEEQGELDSWLRAFRRSAAGFCMKSFLWCHS